MPRGKRSSPKDLRSQIKKLTEQLAFDLQKINEQRYATTLTTEILSIIFEYACIDSATSLSFPVTKGDSTFLLGQENKGYRYVPLALSDVCARWRQVAWSTPSLWTSLSLRFVLESYFIRTAASILRLYMQNSGSFPISLEVDFQDCVHTQSNDSSRRALEDIREIIFRQNPRKFRALRVTCPPTIHWVPLSGSGFSALEDFSIHTSPTSTMVIRLKNFTNLHRLHFHGVPGLTPQQSLPNITVLYLQYVTKEVCISLLAQCPNLISYQSYHMSSPYSNLPELRKSVISSKLKDFGWDYDDRLFDSIKPFSFPSIEKLQLHTPTMKIGFLQKDFFPNISSTLCVLELGSIPSLASWRLAKYAEKFFKESFTILVNVTKLTLSNSCVGTWPCMLASLTPSAGCGDLILPQLSILQCRDLKASGVAKRWKCDSRRLAKMLRMRMSQGWNGPLKFEVIGGCGIVWRKDVQKEIRAMVAEGMRLQIIENGRPVNWLRV